MKLVTHTTKEEFKSANPSVFFSIISYNEDEVYFAVKKELEKIFSDSSYESSPMPKWVLENSQKWIIGNNTKILSFKRRINREELPLMKKKCVKICAKYQKKDESLKIIPGYLSLHNVIISTTTDDFHKIYLFHGVYAEIVYQYQGGKLLVSENSSPFFATKEAMYFYKNLRESFLYETK